MSKQLPVWFALDKKLESGKLIFEESQWKKLLFERVDILGINGEKKFDRVKGETVSEFKERADREVISHKLLNLAVCMNPRFSAWFVENEGDLFSFRFERLKLEEKKVLLNYLYASPSSSPSWLELEELQMLLKEDLSKKLKLPVARRTRKRTGLGRTYKIEDTHGNTKLVAFNYKFIPYLLKHRKVLIYKGWAIDTFDKFFTSIKHQYESILNRELELSAEKFEDAPTDVRNTIEAMTDLLVSLIKPQTKSYGLSEFVIQGNFDTHLNIYPPCIRDLVQRVDEVGYIAHWERFQLGLFLKHTGMDIDDQLRYWYSKAVDNIGLTYEEFIKRAGYVIRHIYGLVGGKIDYEMPSCTTIQDKMFCTFRHRDLSTIEDALRNLVENPADSKVITSHSDALIENILDQSAKGFPNQACATFLRLFKPHNLPEIKHPMIYLKIAGEGSDILKIKNEMEDDNANQ